MPVLHGSVVSDRAFIQIHDDHLIDRLMVDRLVMSGVMQTQISIAQQRIADDIRKRRVYWRAGPDNKVFIKGVVAMRDTQNRALAGQLQRVNAEIVG